jgi:hypothetical protein
VLSIGKPTRYQQFTTALKSANQFASIFYRRYPHLNNPEIEIDDSYQKRLSLGTFDEQKFNLIVALYIGKKDRTFIQFKSESWKVLQVQFGDFNLVFLVSFLSLPAVIDGDATYPISSRDDKIPHPNPNGLGELDAIREFELVCLQLRELYIIKLMKAHNASGQEQFWRDAGMFFADGAPDATDKIKAHLATLAVSINYDKGGDKGGRG